MDTAIYHRLLLGWLSSLLIVLASPFWLTASPLWADEPASAAPSEAADATPTTLVLGSQEPYTAIGGGNARLLIRELVRQAVLIGARDELGLATRDATLREFAGSDTKLARPLEIQTSDFRGRYVQIKVLDKSQGGSQSILDKRIDLPVLNERDLDYLGLVEAAEKLSRVESVEALRKTGFSGQPDKADPAVPLPGDVDKQLNEMNAFSQFAAVRAVHELHRSSGQSPATLSALSRGYANLGQLTQYHWNATHKAFKARALLYAQRLIARDPSQPEGFWCRGYALALTGLHATALADFETARNLAGIVTVDSEASKSAPGDESDDNVGDTASEKIPAWARLAEVHCRYDDDALLEAARAETDSSELAWMLAYITVEHNDFGPAYALTIGRQAADAVPDCLRIVDSMCAFGGVSNLHYATTVGPQSLAKSINRRIRPMRGLPTEIATLIKEMRSARIRNEAGDAWGRDICSVFDFHPQLIAELDAAGEPARDTQEPSWSVLARLIEEPTFIQIYRRGAFFRNGLSVPLDEFVKYATPLVAGHPYHAAVDVLAIDASRQRDRYWNLFKDFELKDVELQARLLIEATFNSPHQKLVQGLKAWNTAHTHLDETAREFELWERTMDPKGRVWYANAILRVSPHNPAGIASLITFDWDESSKKADGWAGQYSQQPLVMGALAHKYRELKRPEEAKKAYENYVAKSPDQWAYVELADMYLAEGNVEKWNATLDEFLKHEDYALSHASVRVRVAKYYMQQGDFAKALPYAELAAQSGASWAMTTAANCYEGVGDFKRAEELVAENAGRYAGQQPTWFFWCKRTGHGDVGQAAAMANEYFANIMARARPDDFMHMATFYLLNGKELAARDALRKAYKRLPTAFLALHEALLFDAMGEPKSRDEALTKAIDTPIADDRDRPFNEASVALAKLFQESLAAGNSEGVTKEKVDAILEPVKQSGTGTSLYFVARFLDRHGDKQLAQEYWERCAAQKSSSMHIVAIDHLRNVGGGGSSP